MKCDEGIMPPVIHFREPAAAVSRCVSRAAVSCLSRSPEIKALKGEVGRYGGPVTMAKRLLER
jgi:hypothetical protein